MALVVKNSQLILNSTVNLNLLKNYGKKYKKELVFVNPDPVIVEKVIKAGFHIYENLNTLERNLPLSAVKATDSIAVGSEDNHSDSKGTDKKIFSHKKREFTPYFSIFLLLLILGLAYFYFFYPTATVEVRPVIRTASQELTVIGSIDHNRIDWQNNILPIRQTQVEISGEEEIGTSAYKLIGDSPARGVVRFINERQEDIQIPAGTIL